LRVTPTSHHSHPIHLKKLNGKFKLGQMRLFLNAKKTENAQNDGNKEYEIIIKYFLTLSIFSTNVEAIKSLLTIFL
jgi:hypothetical protein